MGRIAFELQPCHGCLRRNRRESVGRFGWLSGGRLIEGAGKRLGGATGGARRPARRATKILPDLKIDGDKKTADAEIPEDNWSPAPIEVTRYRTGLGHHPRGLDNSRSRRGSSWPRQAIINCAALFVGPAASACRFERKRPSSCPPKGGPNTACRSSINHPLMRLCTRPGYAQTKDAATMPTPTVAEAVAQYGRGAYLLTIANDGPHTSFVSVDLKGNVIACAIASLPPGRLPASRTVAVLAAQGAGRLRSHPQSHSHRTARAQRRDQGEDDADQISPSSRGTEACRQRRAVPVRLPAHRKAGITILSPRRARAGRHDTPSSVSGIRREVYRSSISC
jgi:hypothetical protein